MHLSGSAVYTLSRSGHPDITTPQNIGHRGGGLGVGGGYGRGGGVLRGGWVFYCMCATKL